MPGAVEFAEVEARISRMTAAELVDMADHPEDYEEWAVELGRAELARRGLAPERVVELRSENVAEAAAATRAREATTARLTHKWGLLFAVLALPLLRLLSTASSRDESKTQEESGPLSVTCAQVLAKASGGVSSGNLVKLDRHSVATTVVIEQVRELPGGTKTAAGIGVTCAIDGHPVAALTSGSIGIDTTREGALQIAVEDWVTEYGTPIVNVLSGKSPTLRVGLFDVYTGPTGIRGTPPEHLGDVNTAFFREVAPALSHLVAESSLHTLTVMVVWRPDGPLEGEFRVDNEVSDPLKQLAMKVKWPESQALYMLRQYYILNPATGGRAH